MDKGYFLVFGAMIGAIAALIAAKITSSNQIKIAQMNTQTNIEIQERNNANNLLEKEVSLRRERLAELLIILSKLTFEYSQTNFNIGGLSSQVQQKVK